MNQPKMSREEFHKIINLLIISWNKNKDLNKRFNIDVSELILPYEKIIEMLLSNILTSQGHDLFDWFLYEKEHIYGNGGRPEIRAWDENDKEICRNVDELYDELVKQNYFVK